MKTYVSVDDLTKKVGHIVKVELARQMLCSQNNARAIASQVLSNHLKAETVKIVEEAAAEAVYTHENQFHSKREDSREPDAEMLEELVCSWIHNHHKYYNVHDTIEALINLGKIR